MDHLTRRVYEARKQRKQLLSHHATAKARAGVPADYDQAPLLKERMPDNGGRHVVLAVGLAAVMVAGILVWSLLGNWRSGGAQPSDVNPLGTVSGAAVESVAGKRLEARLDDLADRVESISGLVDELASKLARAQVLLSSITDAGDSAAPGSGRSDPDNSPTSLSRTSGPWVINLMSSPIKSDADEYEKRLRRQGIQTEQQQVSIGGKTYWRVQIVGFDSRTDARARATQVAEQLGLRDFWIMKR